MIPELVDSATLSNLAGISLRAAQKAIAKGIPRYHSFSALRITDDSGTEVGIAHADKPFEVLDQRGAKESARRSNLRNRALVALGRTTPDIDVGNEIIRHGQRQAAVVPNTPDAIISVNRPGRHGLALPPTKAEDGPTHQDRMAEARRVDKARAILNAALTQEAS